jgi:hypothetical protein
MKTFSLTFDFLNSKETFISFSYLDTLRKIFLLKMHLFRFGHEFVLYLLLYRQKAILNRKTQ